MNPSSLLSLPSDLLRREEQRLSPSPCAERGERSAALWVALVAAGLASLAAVLA